MEKISENKGYLALAKTNSLIYLLPDYLLILLLVFVIVMVDAVVIVIVIVIVVIANAIIMLSLIHI